MKIAFSFVLGFAIMALAGPSQYIHAVESVEPTPEEKARCEARADDRGRKFCLQAYSVKGLKFPDEAEELGFFTNLSRMGIFKPKGQGPFPTIMLLHTCGSVSHQQMRYWVPQILASGYVAFVVDSWGQRGIPQGVCFAAPPGFNAMHVRARDSYEALAHLSKFGFVDTSRVAVMGFSHGGRVAYLLGSKEIAETYSPGKQRFVASVAVYGECFSRERKQSYLLPDIDVPLLSLLGELDEDGDPKECLPRLQALKDKGKSVEWYVFPKTGHAWDQSRFSPPQRIPYTGSPSGTALYAYDAKVTDESRDRAFQFLAPHLKQK